ncbi:hypothetical protein AB1N83_012750, partial [Pleurotus pulmonarius]
RRPAAQWAVHRQAPRALGVGVEGDGCHACPVGFDGDGG